MRLQDDNNDEETQNVQGKIRPLIFTDKATAYETGIGAPEAVNSVGELCSTRV